MKIYGIGSLGLHTDGSFAEYVVMEEQNVIAIPTDLPPDKAALVEPPLSVSAQAIKEGNVKEGDSVAIFGCAPIGLFAIIAAKAKGEMVVIAIHARDFEFNPVSLMLSGVRLSSSMGYEPKTFKNSIDILMNKEINVSPIMTKKFNLTIS